MAAGRFKFLAAAADAAWYQEQLQRMGRGLEPEPELSTLVALGRSLAGFLGGPKLRRTLAQ